MSKFKILGRFVSKADEAAQALKREKGTGEEFLREIQKTPGVKAAEIKDRKLDKVLPTMGKTTKAEVLKKLEQNPPPKLEETVRGGGKPELEPRLTAADIRVEPEGDQGRWFIESPTGSVLARANSEDEAVAFGVRYFNSHINERNRLLLKDADTSKYGQYQIPGGENYREILLRLPGKKEISDAEIANWYKDTYGTNIERDAGPDWRSRRNEFIQDMQGLEREDKFFGEGQYASPHWDEPNVLAHARVSDRVGPNGEKILHVEEIQSDWHQQGRKQGYQDPNVLEQRAQAEAARKAAQSVLDEAQEKVRAAKTNTQRYEGIINDPRFPTFPAEYQTSIKTLLDRYTKVWMDELPNLMKAQKEFDALPDPATMKTTGVPDAPFKKNWHELTMKRILDYAADKGYDKIAITPGAEQAKRYDLSKQIGKLEYDFGPADTVGHLKAYGLDGGRVIDRTVKPEELADYIGKEAAEKLIKTPAVNNTHMLEGVDLQVGGEGMKGFYDQILPTYLNDLGKPYGATVGQMDIITKPEQSIPQIAAPGIGHFPEPIIEPAQTVKVHTFDITPQMREEIKAKGLPLYQVGAPIGAGAAQQALPTEEPEGPPVPVQFTDNPDVMQLELARGGAVRMDEGGAAFGVFPQMKKKRSKQDKEAAKNVPVDVARGFVAGALGMPGDIESLVRMLPGLDEETVLPTSEDILKRIPLGSDTPTGRAASGLGTLAGGFYTGPGSGARAITAVPKAVMKAGQDFAEASAQGVPHVYRPHTPLKPDPEVGTRYKTEFQGGLAPRIPLNIEDLEKSSVKIFPWDATSRNRLVTEVSEIPLTKPVLTEGGDEYMMDLGHIAQRIAGASNEGIAKRIQDRINQASVENRMLGGTGKVFGFPSRMGERAEYAATFPTDIVMDLLKQAELKKKELKALDQDLRNMVFEGDRGVFKDMAPIGTPEFEQQLRTGLKGDKKKDIKGFTDMNLRKALMDRLSKVEYQKRLGYNIQDLSGSVLSEELKGVPKGFVGNVAAELDPFSSLRPSKSSTYSHDFAGQYAGSMPNMPVEFLMPNTYEGIYRQMKKDYPESSRQALRNMTIGAMEKRKENISEMIGPRTIDAVKTFQEGLKKGDFDPKDIEQIYRYMHSKKFAAPKKKGGAVKKEDAEDTKPRKKVTFTDNLDAMRMALDKK